MSQFFVSTQIGFEEELIFELKEFWPFLLNKEAKPHGTKFPEFKIEKGGIEIDCEEILGLQINFFTKLAGRVLLRVGKFKAREFAKLESEFRKLRGKINVASIFKVEVAASQSRLNNEKRIEKCFLAATKINVTDNELTQDEQFQNEQVQKIFIRMNDDECTVSLDTSGEHLHFRGYRQEQGEAPLRETIACYCLRKMIGASSAAELSGVTLVDPMVGSGTFLIEAARLYQPQFQIQPQLQISRQYPFLNWKSCPVLLTTQALAANFIQFPILFKSTIGRDCSKKMIEMAQRNFQRASLLADLHPVNLQVENVFCLDSSNLSQNESLPEERREKVWVISNPPYGARLEKQFSIFSLIIAVSKKWSPQKMGFILEKNQVKEIKAKSIKQEGYRILSESPFKNGGLSVSFVVFERISTN